jgi:excisionase family DNA binding protein
MSDHSSTPRGKSAETRTPAAPSVADPALDVDGAAREALMVALPVEFVDVVVEAVSERVLAVLRAEREHEAVQEVSPFMTIAEAAEWLRCKRQHVDDLLSAGRLRRYKDGSRTLVSRDELAAHVRADGPRWTRGL